jgi:hypothetical protein
MRGTAAWGFLMLHRTRVSRVTYPRPLDKRVTVAVVAAGGTGYEVDDTVTLANGVVLTVATVTDGAVATVTITNAGRVNGTDPTNPQAQVSTDGFKTLQCPPSGECDAPLSQEAYDR